MARMAMGPSVYMAEYSPARERMLKNSRPGDRENSSGRISRSGSVSSSSSTSSLSTLSSATSSSSTSTLSRFSKIIKKLRNNKSDDSLSRLGDYPYETAECLFPKPVRLPSKGPAGQELTMDKREMQKITIWSSSTRDDEEDAQFEWAEEVKTRLLETAISAIEEVRDRFYQMKLKAEQEAKRPLYTLDDLLARRQRRSSPVRITDGKLTEQLCSVLEAIFLHGLVEVKFRSFWPVAEKLSTPGIVDFVTSSRTAQTEIAMSRIWIRCLLNSKTLGDVLAEIFSEYLFIRKMYQPYAFLNDTAQRGMLRMYADGLSKVDFWLDTEAYLNTWTRQTLALSAHMQPFDPRNLDSSSDPVPPCPVPSLPLESTEPRDELANITAKDIRKKGNNYYLRPSRRRLSVHDVRRLRNRGVLPDACPCLCCHAVYVYPDPPDKQTTSSTCSSVQDDVSSQLAQTAEESDEKSDKDLETGREELPRRIFAELR